MDALFNEPSHRACMTSASGMSPAWRQCLQASCRCKLCSKQHALGSAGGKPWSSTHLLPVCKDCHRRAGQQQAGLKDCWPDAPTACCVVAIEDSPGLHWLHCAVLSVAWRGSRLPCRHAAAQGAGPSDTRVTYRCAGLCSRIDSKLPGPQCKRLGSSRLPGLRI